MKKISLGIVLFMLVTLIGAKTIGENITTELNKSILENNNTNVSNLTDGLAENGNETEMNETMEEGQTHIENNTDKSNETSIQENRTEITIMEGPLNQTNETVNLSQHSETTTLEFPRIFVGIAVPKKITRGEAFSVTVTLNNAGSPVSDVDVSLLMPDGFSVVDYQSDCSSLSHGQTCSAFFVVNTSLSVPLGENDFNVVVRYE